MKDPDIHGADSNGCLSIPANTDPTIPFWLSMFVVMTNDGKDLSGNPDTTFANNPDGSFAQQNKNNKTSVTVAWTKGCALTAGGDLSAAVFQLYVGDPSTAMTTTNTTLLTPSDVAALTSPGTATKPVEWTPSNTATDPSGPGHKCLVARCFPLGTEFVTPLPAAGFSAYVNDDPHYAQHNLTIGLTDVGSPMKMKIQTANASDRQEVVTLQVVQDLQPTAGVLRVILPSLQTVPAFKRIAAKPAPNISLDFSAIKKECEDFDDIFEDIGEFFEDAVTKLFGSHKHDHLNVKFPIPPNFHGPFTLQVDVKGSTSGDAHILHITQRDQSNNPQGGLTVAVVVT